MLKVYFKTHLKTGFIWLSKSPADTPILFDKNLDGSLQLHVDYKSLNSLTIKSCYLLLLIDKFLDRLGCAERLTQLDLTSTYYRMRIWQSDKWKRVFCNRYGYFKY